MHHTLQTTQIHAVLTIPIPTSSHLQSGLFIKYFKQSLISERSLNTFSTTFLTSKCIPSSDHIFKLAELHVIHQKQPNFFVAPCYLLSDQYSSLCCVYYFLYPHHTPYTHLKCHLLTKAFPLSRQKHLFLPQILTHVSSILLSILPCKYVFIYLSSLLI